MLPHSAVTLHCLSENGSVRWFHNGRIVGVTDRHKILANGSFLILSVEEDDIGDYYCQVGNPYVGVIRSRTVKLEAVGEFSVSKLTLCNSYTSRQVLRSVNYYFVGWHYDFLFYLAASYLMNLSICYSVGLLGKMSLEVFMHCMKNYVLELINLLRVAYPFDNLCCQ